MVNKWLFSALIILDILVLIDSRGSPTTVSQAAIGLGAAAIVAGAIAATAAIFSAKSASDTNASNAASQERINQANVISSQNANAMARLWANQDYDRQNSYNSPLQQMQRLKEASLNPHLVYGSGAQSTASQIRATDPKVPRQDPTHMAPLDFSNIGQSVQGGLGNYMEARQSDMDLQLKQKQYDLLNQEERKRELLMIGQITKNDQSAFNLGVQKELRDTTVQQARTKLDSSEMDVVNKNSSYLLMQQKYGLNQLQAQKLTSEIGGIAVQSALRQIELDMLKSGRSKSDPYYIRAMRNIADVVSKKTGVDVSIVSDILSAGKGVKMPKGGVKSVKDRLQQNYNNTNDWMKNIHKK